MSLPIYLDIQPHELWNGPYLHANDPSLKLNGLKNIKIGIRWTGNPEYEQDLHRKVPLDQLCEVLDSFPFEKHFQIFSIQRDDGVLDLEKSDCKKYVTDLSDKLIDWESSINIINSLNLVITSCTSIAHVSAALGKPTIVLVPITAYYTWASTTDESSIWYGENLTVLRQTKHKSWKEPLDRLKEILECQKL